MCILLGIILTHFARKYREINQNETLENETSAVSDEIIMYASVYGEFEDRTVG